jgi:hypothetical protein
MRHPSKLTPREKKAGKRKLLIPSKEIQEMMQSVSFEDFEKALLRTIPLPKAAEKSRFPN